MKRIEYFITQSATFRFAKIVKAQAFDFFETFGRMSLRFFEVMKYILTGQFSRSHIIEQSSKFAIDSLPITLTIVAMTSVILAVQVAPEMVKQGGANFIGGLLAIVTVREMGTIMTGFAIISMIGSSMASEIATIASTIGIFCGGFVSSLTSPEVTGLCFINSVKLGLFNRDIGIMLLKASCFGAAIAHISSSCGYDAEGGAKSVGIATTKAVVWSFIGIVVIDYIFALIFYF